MRMEWAGISLSLGCIKSDADFSDFEWTIW